MIPAQTYHDTREHYGPDQICQSPHCSNLSTDGAGLHPETGLCAACTFDAREAEMLQQTWTIEDESSPEWLAVSRQLDELERGGIGAVEVEIFESNNRKRMR